MAQAGPVTGPLSGVDKAVQVCEAAFVSLLRFHFSFYIAAVCFVHDT